MAKSGVSPVVIGVSILAAIAAVVALILGIMLMIKVNQVRLTVTQKYQSDSILSTVMLPNENLALKRGSLINDTRGAPLTYGHLGVVGVVVSHAISANTEPIREIRSAIDVVWSVNDDNYS